MAVFSSAALANRIGFIILGLTNNFAYVVMLSAAYDLLKQNDPDEEFANDGDNFIPFINSLFTSAQNNDNSTATTPANLTSGNNNDAQPFCNKHSTSTVLLADSLPSLTTKLVYPFLLVNIKTNHKAVAVSILAALSFLITGLSSNKYLIFFGVACASFACGLGETTYLSNSPRYGSVAISGWSTGTGVSGLLGSIAYALLRMVLPIHYIMAIMLVSIPSSMLLAYFYVITPVDEHDESGGGISASRRLQDRPSPPPPPPGQQQKKNSISISVISSSSDEDPNKPIWNNRKSRQQMANYGVAAQQQQLQLQHHQHQESVFINHQEIISHEAGPMSVFLYDKQPVKRRKHRRDQFSWREKLAFLPSLAKYFLPLFLVYFAEFFINQGLHELIYFPEIASLDHAAQYRWFQVTYQFGVMISRASLDFLVIRYLWTMSLLQLLNAIVFLGHVGKLIYIPDFYLVLAIIIYEGLLGGFTYANTFYRMREELPPNRQEFGISTVVIADTLGIVLAGSCAIPVHDELCKLYAAA